MDSRMLVICCMLVVMAASCPTTVSDNCECNKSIMRDCGEILENNPSAESGDYLIQPHDGKPAFTVYCDMRTDGGSTDGGWTVIQRREDGSVNFYRNWANYKDGFGNVNSEFWIGNEQINRITSDGDYELLIEITDHLNVLRLARYSHFRIGTEDSNYRMSITGLRGYGFTGTAGNPMEFDNGQPFSTFDKDNDENSNLNLAVTGKGGWWYRLFTNANLNGPYRTPGPIAAGSGPGINWYSHTWPTYLYSHKKIVMMIKRTQ
ncbi:fibrinogen-like protein A [Antedon mediterranea]|uniref:fibrinogen-like protein A n=1 Tax=Antedon mediterranea TaxID=105859 RepID=UPI003AF9AB50